MHCSASVQRPYSVGLETTPQIPSVNLNRMSRYQAHIFSHLAGPHLRTIASLNETAEELNMHYADEEATFLRRLAAKLDDCCRTPQVMVNEATAEFALQEYRCKSRICGRCNKARCFKLTDQFLPIVKKFDDPRMITLTPKSNNKPLREQIQKLSKDFANLRRSKLWKLKYTVGFWTIEVTHNNTTDQWHPHIHAIVDGDYIHHPHLKKLWHAITGDSFIVWLKRCPTAKRAVEYITGYVTKTSDVTRIPKHRIADWAVGLKGLRLINTFGGLKPSNEDEEDRESWEGFDCLTPMSLIEARINEGNQQALAIWEGIIFHASRGSPDQENDKDGIKEAQRFELLQDLRKLIDPEPPPPSSQPPQAPNTPRLFTDHPTIGD